MASALVKARPVLVVAGLGNGSGTGAATARLFAKSGYSVALVARGEASTKKLADELNAAGGNAVPFPVGAYSADELSSVWQSIRSKFAKPEYAIRVAVFNAGFGVFKSFLDVTQSEFEENLQVNVAAPFAFSKEAIQTFISNDVEEPAGKRGTLIFTGATASIRGNTMTSGFSPGKHGLRALSQSLAKEFGKQNIHVAHSIIDGTIATDRTRDRVPKERWEDENQRLSPDSIAASYLYLAQQDRSVWTWELDLRPAHEKW